MSGLLERCLSAICRYCASYKTHLGSLSPAGGFLRPSEQPGHTWQPVRGYLGIAVGAFNSLALFSTTEPGHTAAMPAARMFRCHAPGSAVVWLFVPFLSGYRGIGQDSSFISAALPLSDIRHLVLSRDRADDGIRTHSPIILDESSFRSAHCPLCTRVQCPQSAHSFNKSLW